MITQNNMPTKDEISTLPDTFPSIEITTQDSSTDSDTSDKECLEALESTGVKCKTKVCDKRSHPNSGPCVVFTTCLHPALLSVTSCKTTKQHMCCQKKKRKRQLKDVLPVCILRPASARVQESIVALMNCYIIFFYRLTAISVIALLNAIAEAVSDNRELTRVFHQISGSLHQPFSITSDLLDISTPHEYADICY